MNGSSAYNDLSVTDAAKAIGSGAVSCVELMQDCISRIDAREGSVGAWTFVDRERALNIAREKDRNDRPKGALLHGIPIGVKDIIDTAGISTRCGSRLYEKRVPKWDAACVALVKKAGAIVLGKTVTTEFAYFSPGKTANPIDVAHTPGGSSSGSAAAVADRMVPAAFGTQTAASIVRPASFCGIVGYKPSTGAFSLAGVKPLAESLDTLGLLTREAEDLKLLRAALLGFEDVTQSKAPTKAVTIAVCRTPWWNEAEQEARTALEEAALCLQGAGACVEELALPEHFADLAEDQKLIMSFDAARALAHEFTVAPDALSPELTTLIEAGLRTRRSDYVAAQERARRARAEFDVLMKTRDAILAPSAKGAAPRGHHSTGDPIFSRMWTLIRVPTISLPTSVAHNGLPIGVQLIGAFEDDDRLIDLASWCQPHLSGTTS